MKYCCTIVSVLCLLFCKSVAGQNLPETILYPLRAKPLVKQIKYLDSTAMALRTSDLSLSRKVSEYSIALSKKNRLDSLTINTYLILSRTSRFSGILDTALMYIDSAKHLALANKLTKKYYNLLVGEGVLHTRKGDYESATRSLYKSIEYAEQAADSMALHDAFEQLGTVSFYRKDYRGAVRFYKKALDHLNSGTGTKTYFVTVDNLGLAYSNLQKMDSALFYQKLGIHEIEKTKDSVKIAESCINIGTTLVVMKNLPEAERYLLRGYAIHRLLRNEYGIQVSSLYLGRMYLENGNAKKALPYLEQAYTIAARMKVETQLKETLQALTRAYHALGDYKKAAEHYALLTTLIEKAYIEENSKTINELSTKYETEKKQQQIQLLTSDRELKQQRIEKDRYIKLLTASIALLLLGLSLVFIFRFRKKKKDHQVLMEKNLAIARQKSEIEAQKELLLQKNQEITDSINYARRIQHSVLPSQALVQKLFPQSFIYFQPRDIISGDFYWVSHNKGYTYFAVADCTGHGVPGAMMSMLGTALLNQIVLGSKTELPSDILKELHHHLLRSLNENMEQRQSKDGMDIAMIRVDVQKKELMFAGGGRSLYLARNGELITIKGDKHSIGSTIYEDNKINYELHRVDISEPLQIYLFTDGVPDQFGGPRNSKFLTRNLLQLLTRLAALPLPQQEKDFVASFENWKQGHEQTDDITLVSIKLP